MRILVFVFLVLVLTQRVSADEVIDLRSHLENYQITEGGEYHFTTNGELWEYGIIATAQDEITIILEDVNIKSVSPIDCNKAKDVYVIIKGSNILDNSYQDRIKAAISAPANVNGQLVINGTNNDDLMITATYGACIGWDNYEPIHGHNSSRLVINGGRYLLQSYFGAGIGASQGSVFGHIIVNGGIINSSSCYGMGIGIDGAETLPDNPMETQITIHGGTITAHSDIYYGIGDPCNKNKAAYFYSNLNGVPGNAFVISNGIELLNTQVQAEYIGVFFTDEQTKVGRVYGKPVLSTDAEIPEGYTLEVCSDEVLTVAEGTKLTNSGSLEINSGGSFVNNGNLIINGSVENKGTIINNGNITIYDNKEDVVIDGIQFYDISFDPNGENVNGMPIKISTTSESNVQVAINTLPTRDGYLFVGWSISPDAKEAVYIDNKFEIKISNESVKLYAIWKSNIFNVDSSKEIEMNYGDDLYLLDLSTLVSCIDEKVDFFPVVSYELVDNTIDGVSLEDNLLIINSSIMKVGSAYEIKIKFSNGISSSDKTATVGLKIEPRKLRIIYPEIEVLYSDEVEKFKSSIQFGGAKEGEVPAYNHDKFAEKDGVLSLKSIELVNNELFIASNYTIDYKELVDIKIIQNIASEQNVSITYGSKGNNGWYTSDIKIECPEGFTIEGEKVALKDASSKIDLIISEEGNYDFEYTIKSFSHSKTDKLSVALDKTGPIVDLTTKNYTSATFTIMDNVSGIASYEYTLDNNEPVLNDDLSITDPITITLPCKSGNHTLLVNAVDLAGNTMDAKTISFTIENEPYYPPVPLPNYYSVIIPEIEGVSFSSGNGSFDVAEDYAFGFYLYVNEGYMQNSKPVVLANGEEIVSREVDGKYIIKHVTTDTTIEVTGIVKDHSTANTEIENSIKIWSLNSILSIYVPRPLQGYLIDLSGNIIKVVHLSAGENSIIGVPSGLLILKLEGMPGRKIVIE